MSDRDLLELAARGAGIEVSAGWSERLNAFYVEPPQETGAFVGWNPLTDNGDALRLAVKLAMYVALDNDKHEVVACAAEGDVVKELCGDDPYTATRRAIVRAAAEIGRAMKVAK